MLELYFLEEAESICSNRMLMNGDQFKPEYLRLNPNAQVPTLVHDGKPTRESFIICNYVDDLTDAPALKLADPGLRAEMQEWIKDSDETGYQATASINFVTQFRLSVPIEKMEAPGNRSPISSGYTASNPASAETMTAPMCCAPSTADLAGVEDRRRSVA